MNINPYINKIDTNIVKMKHINGKTHVATKDHIIFDYDKLNCFTEQVYLNDKKVESIYQSSLGPIYVIEYTELSEIVTLYVDYDKRKKLLNSMTYRYLIPGICKKYLGLKAYGFSTEEDLSAFRIDNIYYDHELTSILTNLESVLKEYLNSGLDIKTSSTENGKLTKIDGIYKGRYICPHLANLSELEAFQVSHYNFTKNGLTIYYHNR